MLFRVKTAALLSEAIYSYPSGAAIAWDYVAEGPIYWALKQINGENYVCFRGSTTVEDWVRDFNALVNPITHFELGPVHPGFLANLPEAWEEIKTKVSKNIVFTGHSLGSGEVDICSGLAVLDGIIPIAKIGFGSPKPGFKQLGQIVKNVPDFCFRNTDGIYWDLITSLPATFYPEEYEHVAPLFNVNCPPEDDDAWGPFAWHRMQYYRRAVEELTENDLIAHHVNAKFLRAKYFKISN
jgi:hypothetical protein